MRSITLLSSLLLAFAAAQQSPAPGNYLIQIAEPGVRYGRFLSAGGVQRFLKINKHHSRTWQVEHVDGTEEFVLKYTNKKVKTWNVVAGKGPFHTLRLREQSGTRWVAEKAAGNAVYLKMVSDDSEEDQYLSVTSWGKVRTQKSEHKTRWHFVTL